jgi:glycosyltransferase involved in cell wall biosynthesis
VPDERWLLVSKPLREPWVDGSTVLVRELVAHLPPGRRLSYLGDPRHPIRPQVDDEVVAAPPMGHAPGLLEKARVLGTIAAPGRRRQPLCFFFTPGRVTSTIVGAVRRATPRRPVVQTIMSSYGVLPHVPALARLDAVVTLSAHAREQLADAGVPAARLHAILPGVSLPVEAPPAAVRRRVVYAGDLDPTVVRRLIAVGRALERPELAGWSLSIAARPKGPDDARHRAVLQAGLAAPIAAGRAEVLGEISDAPGWLAGAGIQLFVADHVARKVDLPLVLLEGLARGVGLIAGVFPPLDEIFARAAVRGLAPGVGIPGKRGDAGFVEELARVAAQPQTLLAWSRDARELALAEFSVARMADEFERLFRAFAAA